MSPVVQGQGLTLQYGKTHALRKVDLSIPAGCMVGLIGPDGVGKSSLLALISGARRLQQGELQVLGGDMRSQRHRRRVCPDIAYMPQGLGVTSTRPYRWKKTCSFLPACLAIIRPSVAAVLMNSRPLPA